MDNLVDLSQTIEERKKKKESDKLDARASIVVLHECLKMINLNKLQELNSVKKSMSDTIKILRKTYENEQR